MSNSVLYISYVEQLETRISDLIEERDKYDKRRRAAMELVEYWRGMYNRQCERLIKYDWEEAYQNAMKRGAELLAKDEV